MSSSLHGYLTNNELQITSLPKVSKKLSKIAAELSIGISTVKSYCAHIFAKLDLCSNAKQIRCAVQSGLTDRTGFQPAFSSFKYQ